MRKSVFHQLHTGCLDTALFVLVAMAGVQAATTAHRAYESHKIYQQPPNPLERGAGMGAEAPWRRAHFRRTVRDSEVYRSVPCSKSLVLPCGKRNGCSPCVHHCSLPALHCDAHICLPCPEKGKWPTLEAPFSFTTLGSWWLWNKKGRGCRWLESGFEWQLEKERRFWSLLSMKMYTGNTAIKHTDAEHFLSVASMLGNFWIWYKLFFFFLTTCHGGYIF